MVLYFIERCLPTCTTWPFVVTKTSKCIKMTSLLSCPGDAIVKEKTLMVFLMVNNSPSNYTRNS